MGDKMLIKELFSVILLILIAIMTLINYKRKTGEKSLTIISLILVGIGIIIYLI